ncbi:hypothetical protein H8E88_06920 [candidate division KSB1 bacterium]|nr:hypothetical protein [candidate division KSB1 bacterium]MBL7095682.1 hypothetical protein [candidate division KSB1 bacterium]
MSKNPILTPENVKTKQMRKFRDRWQAVAEIEAEEQKSASIALRWQQLNVIYRMAKGLGLSIEESNVDDESVSQRWAKLKGSLK